MEVGKIIIVGPPGVGKTTLRKVFFEGGSAKYLLEYALEPTHGQESIILNLSKTIGVFDLAGQENDRWLETEEKDIFLNTEIIITVLDISKPNEEIIEFAKKIISLRDELAPDTIIFLIIHKIDLIAQHDLMRRQMEIINSFSGTPKLRIKFTSITETYFSGTLALFIDILQLAVGKSEESLDINFEFIKRVFEFLQFFKTEDSISYNKLKKNHLINEDRIKEVIDLLTLKNHINSKSENGDIKLTLTAEGHAYYNEILKRFDLNKLEELENEILGYRIRPTEEMPPFLGFFLSDKDGKTLFTAEVYEGVLKDYFTNETSKNPMFDIELIPMFISAIEKFSKEINIEDLKGFKLEGRNQNMYIFGFENFTFTVFFNPNINMKPIKKEIQDYFENMVHQNREIFLEVINSGLIDPVQPIASDAKNWLDNLNKKYKDMIINTQVIDFDQAKEVYDRLDTISENIRRKFDKIQAEVKKLKVELMRSILEDQIEVVRKTSKQIQDLIKKYA